MASIKLSQISSGGAIAGATDQAVIVRSGTTDFLVTPVSLDTAQIFSAVQKININAASAPTALTGTIFEVIQADGVISRIATTSFSNAVGSFAGGIFTVRNANGTGASPTTLASGNQIGSFNYHGYDGTNWTSAATIQGFVDGTVATSQVPGRIVFATANSAGTITEVARFDSAQLLTLQSGVIKMAASSAATTAHNVIINSSLPASYTATTITALGFGSAASLTSATSSVHIGYFSGNKITSGLANASVGSGAMQNGTTLDNCTAVGSNAMQLTTSGVSGSSAFGSNAYQTGTGSNTTAIGSGAMQSATSANSCTAVGIGAMIQNQAGYATALGEHSGYEMTSADYSVALGPAALYTVSTGDGNIGIGFVSDYCAGSDLGTLTLVSNASFVGTSVTSVTIGTGSKSFTTQTGLSYVAGLAIKITETATPSNLMNGTVTSYNSGTGALVVNVTSTGGSGTFTDWDINIPTTMGTGKYIYKMTYVINGVETNLSLNASGGGAAITTTAGNTQVAVSGLGLWNGPITCTARKLYRTVVGAVFGQTPVPLYKLIATINDNTTTTYTDITSDANLGAEFASAAYSFIVGHMPTDASVAGADSDRTAYKSHQIVFGSPTYPYSEFWLGGGVWAASPVDMLVSGTGGYGSNVAGANLIFSGGPGTGSAASGSIIFKTAAAGGSGSIWNAVAEIARFTSTGLNLTGKVVNYSGIATSGWGTPAIYGTFARAVGATSRSAAVATYTVGSSDGTFEVSGNVNVTVSTTHSFSLDVTYTDETNTSQTLILPMSQLTGAFITGGLITNVTATGPYESPVMHIRCKASTSITIRPSNGTFTSVTYNAEGIIKQTA